MDWWKIISIMVPAVLVVIGWGANSYFTSRADLKSRRSEIILPSLIKSYQVLSHDISMRDPNAEGYQDKLEKLISDIQLFGTKEQVKMIKQITTVFANKKNSDLNPLLNDLRSDLRGQLNLEEVEGNVQYLRAK